MDASLLEKAMRIAVVAHEGQMRKTEKVPYIVHPTMVAFKLARYDFPETVLAAALVHDVLEDTLFSADALRQELSDDVCNIVETLSEDKSLPWEERKVRYIEAVRAGSDDAKAVSCADKIHNIEDTLAAYDKVESGVWEVFNRGKDKKIWFESEMLAMLKDAWNHPLVDEYEMLVEKMKQLD